ncbi:c-type cytochrome [Roseobacter sinensis]|uniref:Cytochrome c family protein n=1 Tax=Roseobacter sinensis TaxID=2931391 RepID=A0ABT3BDS4_9RHOB|nr:cytochrome c family protein [Roseobacter sp. WL0113]MCV3271726.1 cytochrome c family protein [Roseobacter sp. WL0113]
MLDTMTFTKAAGAVCGALLVFLLGKWAAEELYHVESHGEAAYVIAVEGGEEVAEVEEVDFATVLASADPEAGARVFRKCSACHKLADGENGTGPHLYAVVGREKGAVDGFNYSDTLASMDGAWTAENLNGFLERPSSYAPGTSMSFAGLSKVEERADLIAYLDSLDD